MNNPIIMNNIKHIQSLLSRFLDGQTTIKEEQTLFRFFSQARTLPKELLPYAEYFRDMGSLAPEKRMARPRVLWVRAVIAAAASVALILCVMWGYNQHEERMLARVYGGSYMIVNGQRIDDLSLIKDTIQKTLSEAKRVKERVGDDDVVARAQQQVLQSVPPSQRKQIKDFLSDE